MIEYRCLENTAEGRDKMKLRTEADIEMNYTERGKTCLQLF